MILGHPSRTTLYGQATALTRRVGRQPLFLALGPFVGRRVRQTVWQGGFAPVQEVLGRVAFTKRGEALSGPVLHEVRGLRLVNGAHEDTHVEVELQDEPGAITLYGDFTLTHETTTFVGLDGEHPLHSPVWETIVSGPVEVSAFDFERWEGRTLRWHAVRHPSDFDRLCVFDSEDHGHGLLPHQLVAYMNIDVSAAAALTIRNLPE